MRIRSVLFVGRRNAARSVMAESCFNAAAIPGWRAFSAGWQPQQRADATALRVLAQGGFPVDSLDPKPIAIFRQPGAPQIDLCVFLDTELPGDIASYPATREYWRVADPSHAAHSIRAYKAALESVTARIGELILSGRLFVEGNLPLAS
jgi:protein-tyrosine-phosphatase